MTPADAAPSFALALTLALATPALAQQYELVWEDDFNGTALDTNRWQPQIGTGCPSLCGWGNNELQYYRQQNASVAGGMLTITAREENFAGSSYTSARIRTKDLGDWRYGRFEMRAKLPTGQGLWPAFWMLPTDSVYGTWAASGEIDIMEAVGQEPERVFGTIHYGGPFPGNVFSGNGYTLPTGTFHDDFHRFAVEWDEFEIRWYVDDILYSTKTSWFSTGGPYPAPFNERFHLLLNLAVGGNLPGSPDQTTVFPQEFVIDWVRAYQLTDEAPPCEQVFDDMEHADPLGNGYFVFGSGGTLAAELGDLPPVDSGWSSLQTTWTPGTTGFRGGFGRGNAMELGTATHFEMWLRADPGQEYIIEINLQDDDNGDDVMPSTPDGADDEFQYALAVGPGGEVSAQDGWQLISIPLANFTDDNSFHFGGNGVFDPLLPFNGGNGQLVNVVLALVDQTGAGISFRTDQWRFVQRGSGLAGRVWNDTNGNGIDEGEPGLAGVQVELWDDEAELLLAELTTPVNGAYNFSGLGEGDYSVRIDPQSLPGGSQATYDPDGLASLDRFDQPLSCGESLAFLDFGYEAGNVSNFCQSSPNSQGAGSFITGAGSVSLAANSFSVSQSGAIPGDFGLFYFGPNEVDLPFGEGRRCVGGAVLRLAPAVLADLDGNSSRLLNFASVPENNISPGSTWKFQYWYRDPAGGPSGFNLSNGLSATFTP